MKFAEPLIPARMIKRYKRFLSDVRLENGEEITVHCPNSGSMKSCWEEGWKVLISDSKNPKRKLRHTLEMVHNGNCWIGVNTQNPNKIAYEAIRENRLPEIGPFDELKREVKYGEQNSRIDLLGIKNEQLCYIEVKNVTLLAEDGSLQFPDAVSKRGLKHLEELITMKGQGHDAVMLFVAQRSDGHLFKAAADIDPDYAEGLKRAIDAGVKAKCFLAELSPDKIILSDKELPIKV